MLDTKSLFSVLKILNIFVSLSLSVRKIISVLQHSFEGKCRTETACFPPQVYFYICTLCNLLSEFVKLNF